MTQPDERRTQQRKLIDAALDVDLEDDDGLIEADDDYEEYFFAGQGEGDQYVRVVEDNRMMSGMSGALSADLGD